MGGDNPVEATLTKGATFQLKSAQRYVPIVLLSINDNIKFLENIKQGFKRAVSWNRYRSKITTQSKSNNLDYMIDLTFRNINRLLDPTRDYFDKYYMPLF